MLSTRLRGRWCAPFAAFAAFVGFLSQSCSSSGTAGDAGVAEVSPPAAGPSSVSPDGGVSCGSLVDQPPARGIRIAQLSPDIPAVDICIAPESGGQVDWSTTYPMIRDSAWAHNQNYSPMNYPSVSTYLPVLEGGAHVVRLVGGDRHTCLYPVDGVEDQRVDLSPEKASTLLLAGFVGHGGTALGLRSKLFDDVDRGDPARAGIRFIHASLPLGNVDFGFALEADGVAKKEFLGVALATTARPGDGVDERGYKWLEQPLSHAEVTMWVAGQDTPRLRDTYYNTNACPGEVKTIFTIGVEGSGAAPSKILVCADQTLTGGTFGGTISCVARPPLDDVATSSNGDADAGTASSPDGGAVNNYVRLGNFGLSSAATVDFCVDDKGAPLLRAAAKDPLRYGDVSDYIEVSAGSHSFRAVDGRAATCDAASGVGLAAPISLPIGDVSHHRTVLLTGQSVADAIVPALRLDPIVETDVAPSGSLASMRTYHPNFPFSKGFSGTGNLNFGPTAHPKLASVSPSDNPYYSLYIEKGYGSAAINAESQDRLYVPPLESAPLRLGLTVGDTLSGKVVTRLLFPLHYFEPPGFYEMFVIRDPKAPTDATRMAGVVCHDEARCECFNESGAACF